MNVIDNTNLINMCRDCGAAGFVPDLSYAYNAGAATVTMTNGSTIPSGDTLKKIKIRVHDFFGKEVRGLIEGNTVGATRATATVTITAVGADGDIITVTTPDDVELGTFTKTSSETTVTLLAAALRAAINTGTVTHGYSATNSAGVITISAPAVLGDTVNGDDLVVDDGGTIAATDTAFIGGVTGTSATTEVIDVSSLNRSKPLAITATILTTNMIAADGGAYGIGASGDIDNWDVQKNA